MEKHMNLLLLIFSFITNWIVSASFWALYFLFTAPFFHEELAGNYELLTERILQLSLACVLVPAVLSGTGVMQYFFVRENGGRRAAGETKMYLERLMRDICRRGRLELSDFRLYTAKADDYNAWAIGGNHITVTEHLLNEFSEEEVKGILAHEVGHLQNGHSRFGLLRYGMEWFSGIIVYVYSVVTLLLAFLRWIPVLGIFIGIVNFFILIQYYFLKIFLQIPLWFSHSSAAGEMNMPPTNMPAVLDWGWNLPSDWSTWNIFSAAAGGIGFPVFLTTIPTFPAGWNG